MSIDVAETAEPQKQVISDEDLEFFCFRQNTTPLYPLNVIKILAC